VNAGSRVFVVSVHRDDGAPWNDFLISVLSRGLSLLNDLNGADRA
jgi:hypothetical protein